MGSNDGTFSTVMRKHIHPKIIKPETESLKNCTRLMTKIQRITFEGEYGNILKLLEINVQVGAISALAQFYDSPMRCFTFQDFQMAPTLEEFSMILGYPLEDVKPYQHLVDFDFMSEVASILKDKIVEVERKKKKRNGIDGFPQKYLEGRMEHLAKVEDWVSFREVLALTIFGIVLFPRLDEYVDLAAINVFLAFKHKRESPVPAILADTYCTLTHCHERKGKKLLCCLPTLYVWLITHISQNKCKVTCPITDFKICDIGVKSDHEWARALADLNEKTIRWYPGWKEIHDVIYQCGNFPNVPLIGTRGCINYNPAVALRQLCYPMMHPPMSEVIVPFIVYETDQENAEMLKRIRCAWNRVIRKGKELGKRSTDAKDSYRQWLGERVQQVKLPFESSFSSVEILVQTPVEDEEVKELKEALLKSEKEKTDLQEELEETKRAYERMRSENVRKTTFLERVNKRAKVEEDRKLRLQHDLRASDESLTKRRHERDQALFDKEKLEGQLQRSRASESDVKRQLGDLQQQLERVVAEYKERVKDEKQQQEELVSMYHDLWRNEQAVTNELRGQLQEQQGITDGFKQEAIEWMDLYAKLTWLANQAIIELPDLLKKAEEKVVPFITPKEIVEFINHCENLFEEMKELIRRRR